MPKRSKRMRASRITFLVVFIGTLACNPLLGGEVVTTEITDPASGTTVEAGQVVQIASTSEADAGIARVELLIGGDVVSRDEPAVGNPPTVRLLQSWVAEGEGEVEVSVVAYDADGEASDPAVIVLFIGSAVGGITPTPAEDVESGDCTLNASFVTDITIPDDTEIAPGAPFSKGWRIFNSGTCDWESGFTLVFVSGDHMGGPASVPVPPTPAGDTVDVNVDLQAPVTYGTHRGDWQIRSNEGQMFGSIFWVQIVVPAPATVTPTPTETPTVTPTWSMPVITLFAPTGMIPMFLPYTTHISTTVTVAPGSAGIATATCPSGSLFVGGGYEAIWVLTVYSQFMPNTSSWRVAAWNHAGSSYSLTAYAVCLHNVSGTVSMATGPNETASPGSTAVSIVNCPSGSVVTGGGWATTSSGDMEIYNSSKSSGNGWEVRAYNSSSGTRQIRARAVCLSGTSGTITEESEHTTTSGTTFSVQCECSSGLRLGGGFHGPHADSVFYTSSPGLGVSGIWSIWGRNTSGSSQTFYCYANCISF